MDNYYEQLNNSMGGDSVALPFAAVYFRWQRGNSQISADLGCGAAHFGGWMSDAEAAVEAGIETPEWLSLEYFTYSDGSQKEVLATRILHVAFIGKRSRWETDPNTGRQRSHIQYLAYAANYDHATKVFKPWHPVVLTAKGLNTKHLNNAINQWARLTAGERKSTGYPAWVYWCSIGTFGQFYKLPAGQSYITPPRLVCDPKKINAEYVAARYVGDELGKTMVELADAAQEWLAAWKTRQPETDSDYDADAPAPTQQRRLLTAPTEDDSFPF